MSPPGSYLSDEVILKKAEAASLSHVLDISVGRY